MLVGSGLDVEGGRCVSILVDNVLGIAGDKLSFILLSIGVVCSGGSLLLPNSLLLGCELDDTSIFVLPSVGVLEIGVDDDVRGISYTINGIYKW
jgi:hypothetical protein